MASESTWAKAQADYRTGTTLASICKKYKMTMHELLKRISSEGWTRAGEKRKSIAVVPSVATADRNDKIDAAIAEATADIINSHKSLSRTLREQLDSELGEYQQLKQYLVSALDQDMVEELVRKNPPGTPNQPLLDYIKNCFMTFNVRLGSIDKLVRLAGLLIESERKVWSLDKQSESPDAETWDDLLDLTTAPLEPRQLPKNVASFEDKLRQKLGK